MTRGAVIEEGVSSVFTQDTEPELSRSAPKPTRAPRKDKGTKRPEPARAGVLTLEQVDTIKQLLDERDQALQANTDAEQNMIRACERFDRYLAELQGK
jgi:hypothetical protein